MLWRKRRGNSGAEHAYAHAMLVAGDNALVAIRMAAHTVNAGRVYFAAGSFEPIDFRDGLVDVDFNMIREVGEETGLDLSGAERGKRYHAMSTSSGTVIFRRYRKTASADEIASRISAFVATEEQPEIEGPVIIRDAADLPEGLMGHMKPLIEWHFAGRD
jgi:8-oxo-dGTP pyrophosphatase MutT (NUDIX family)